MLRGIRVSSSGVPVSGSAMATAEKRSGRGRPEPASPSLPQASTELKLRITPSQLLALTSRLSAYVPKARAARDIGCRP